MNDSGFFLLDLNTGGYAPINEDSLERNRELAAHTPGYRVVTKNELPHGPNGAKASAPVRAEIAPPAPATQATDPLLAAFEHDPRRRFVNWRLESPSQKIPIDPHTGAMAAAPTRRRGAVPLSASRNF